LHRAIQLNHDALAQISRCETNLKLAMGHIGRHPRRRTIQYFVQPEFNDKSLPLLDAPLSRSMTEVGSASQNETREGAPNFRCASIVEVTTFSYEVSAITAFALVTLLGRARDGYADWTIHSLGWRIAHCVAVRGGLGPSLLTGTGSGRQRQTGHPDSLNAAPSRANRY
jgi:hypothetical protein